MNDKMSWLLDRLGENSTWRGIIGIVTASGAVLKPEQADKIIAAGIAIVAVINIFRKAPPSQADLKATDAKVEANTAKVEIVANAVKTGDTQFLNKPAETPQTKETKP